MTSEERSRLEAIDLSLRSQQVRTDIEPIIERVRADLSGKNEALMAWEPIPLSIFADALPYVIRSAWVFILRAGANTGAERHPNSHQRMMSFGGTGDMQVRAGQELAWQSNLLVSDAEAPLEERWISIPPNVWHQPVVGRSGDWVVVSFHIIPAEELIEERPAGDNSSGTRRMRYMEDIKKEEG